MGNDIEDAISIEEDSISSSSRRLCKMNMSTAKEIKLLQDWRMFTQKYEWLHLKSYSHFKFLNYGIMIPIIILTSISGSANIILSSGMSSNNGCNSPEGIDYPQLVVGFMTISAAILTTIYNFMKIPELQQKHFTHTSGFNKLTREIEMELVLYETTHKTYSSLEEFIKAMRTTLDRYIDSAPSIPGKILRSLPKFHSEVYGMSIINNRSMVTSQIISTPMEKMVPRWKRFNPTSPTKMSNPSKEHKQPMYEPPQSPLHPMTINDIQIHLSETDQSLKYNGPKSETFLENGEDDTTNDAIKNIERFKEKRISNEFENFKRNIKLRKF